MPNSRTLNYHLNRKAASLVNDQCTLDETGAANKWAATSGRGLVGALNVIAGNPNGSYRDLEGVLNQLAGTSGLGAAEAASRIV